jgi:hypothetical protein
LYIDAEMGRADMRERLEDLGVLPGDLEHFHYTDLPPKLDTLEGAARLLRTCELISPALVVVDGINGVAQGAENDDTTWRNMYEGAIAPLKARNVAVVCAGNTGKDKSLGPRGSSVLVDKPDAIVRAERTDGGIKLIATHRRTAAYTAEQSYTVTGVDTTDPIRIRPVESAWPAGTKRVAAILERLGVPIDASQRAARRAVKEAGETAEQAALVAALRWRRLDLTRGGVFVPHTPSDTGSVSGVSRSDTAGDTAQSAGDTR